MTSTSFSDQLMVAKKRIELGEGVGKFDPLKILYANDLEGRILSAGTPNFHPKPHTVELYTSYLCNEHCDFCSYGFRNEDAGGQQFTKLELDEIKNKLLEYDVKGLLWSGGGEPFFWRSEKDNLQSSSRWLTTEFLEPLLDAGVEMGVMTNAVLADHYFDSLNRFRFLQANIPSIQGASYAAIRKTHTLDRAIENLRHVIRTRSDDNSPYVSIRLIITQQNYEELDNMLAFFIDDLGVDHVSMRAAGNFEIVLLDDEQRDMIYRHVESRIPHLEQYNSKSNLQTFRVGKGKMINQILGIGRQDAKDGCPYHGLGLKLTVTPKSRPYGIVPCNHFVGRQQDRSLGSIAEGALVAIGSERHLRILNQLDNDTRQGHCAYYDLCAQKNYNHVLHSLQQLTPEELRQVLPDSAASGFHRSFMLDHGGIL